MSRMLVRNRGEHARFWKNRLVRSLEMKKRFRNKRMSPGCAIEERLYSEMGG